MSKYWPFEKINVGRYYQAVAPVVQSDRRRAESVDEREEKKPAISNADHASHGLCPVGHRETALIRPPGFLSSASSLMIIIIIITTAINNNNSYINNNDDNARGGGARRP